MPNEKIIEKIQKLFNLAGNNPNEAEAKAALLKAQELMAKYNLEIDNLTGADKEQIKHISISTSLKKGNFTNSLSVIISQAFACKPIIGVNDLIIVFGRKDNAIAAASAMEFAYSVMEKGAKEAVKSNTSFYTSTETRNSYCLGFCKGLKGAMDAQCVALTIVVPDDVKEGFDKKYPNKGSTRVRRVSVGNESAFHSGYEAGSKAMDRRAISG